MAKKYKLGFDIGALLLFVAVMIPNFIWSALPAPNDILRAESVTKTIDAIASVCQALMLAALCFIQDRERKKLSVSPLLIATGLCCLLYYISWLAYYRGLAGAIVILGVHLVCNRQEKLGGRHSSLGFHYRAYHLRDGQLYCLKTID
jgi:hypothetical protein